MNHTERHATIIGSGLGGLATALRLRTIGYRVTILEKHTTPGGRLNQIKADGFTFDMGPSFMSMSYELRELFDSCGISSPIRLEELDPVYQVYFEGQKKPYRIWKNLQKLEKEFEGIEPDLARKVDRYLSRAAEIFHDTEHRVVKRNFKNKLDYFLKLTRVPPKHLPFLWRNMWKEVENTFDSEELRIIFSLVAFFLGSTPFQTPAIYTILNYTELRHDGYWKIEGGMYRLVEALVKILQDRGVRFSYDTEIVEVERSGNRVTAVIDQRGTRWISDIFIANADAAGFRGTILKRPEYSEARLDAMDWTLAPFTVYLGVKGKVDGLMHHNYFLGSNFRGYADTIFTSSISPQKPYYYVNVLSKSYPGCAPEGCENIYILCPVPDLRFKKDWSDKEELADTIINDLSARSGFDIPGNTLVRITMAPDEWARMLNLYKGSGLGLAHGMNQVGAFRPRNKDEELKNLYYVGASTVPGTGLPMVIIGSKLVLERIQQDNGSVLTNELSG
jgi:phytoene desaturase